jgi:hypothetical protein
MTWFIKVVTDCSKDYHVAAAATTPRTQAQAILQDDQKLRVPCRRSSRSLKVSGESWNDFHETFQSEQFRRSSEHIFERGKVRHPPFWSRSLQKGAKQLFRTSSDASLGVRRRQSNDSVESHSTRSSSSGSSFGRRRSCKQGNIKIDFFRSK